MMEPLIFQPSEDTPGITFDPGKNVFVISHRSLPEDAFGYYSPVLDWLNGYSSSPNPETRFVFRLEYFNTASAKQILKILSCITGISQKSKITVEWNYDKGDKDMMASGERFARLTGLSFEMKEN